MVVNRFLIPNEFKNKLDNDFLVNFVKQNYPEYEMIACKGVAVSFKKNNFVGCGIYSCKRKGQFCVVITRVDPWIQVCFGNYVIRKVATGHFYEDVSFRLEKEIKRAGVPYKKEEVSIVTEYYEDKKIVPIMIRVEKILQYMAWILPLLALLLYSIYMLILLPLAHR